MRPVDFTRAARMETLAAADWYRARSEKAAHRFLLGLDHVIERIAVDPLAFPQVRRRTRRALLIGFPYAIFFRATPDVIQIVACFHANRDPSAWKQHR